MDLIAGVIIGLSLPFFYGSFLWWKESKKLDKDKEDK